MKKISILFTILLSTLLLVGCSVTRYDDHYTIVFYMDGLGSKDVAQVEKGAIFERPADPESEHADFIDWYTTPERDELFDFTKPITKSVTIYSKWEFFVFNITYEVGEGGVNHPNNPKTIQQYRLIEQGSTYGLNAPTRSGMIFRSWHFNEDFSDPAISSLNKNNVHGDVTIYARWRTVN